MNPNSDNFSNESSKTRQELADAYGVKPRTLYNWLRDAKIVRHRRVLTPKDLADIFNLFGKPRFPDGKRKRG